MPRQQGQAQVAGAQFPLAPSRCRNVLHFHCEMVWHGARGRNAGMESAVGASIAGSGVVTTWRVGQIADGAPWRDLTAMESGVLLVNRGVR